MSDGTHGIKVNYQGGYLPQRTRIAGDLELTTQEHEEFVRVVTPIYDEARSQYGRDLLGSDFGFPI